MEFNFYQILGVNCNASDEEIKVAYRNLAKKYHPDKHGSNKVYEEHFKKINNAYQTLSKRDKRNRYDLKLRYRATSVSQSTFRNRNPGANHRKTPYSSSQIYKEREKNKRKQEKQKRKIYVLTGLTLLCIISFCIYFYNFMNEYSAELALNKGISEETNKNYFRAFEHYADALEYDDEFTEAYQKRAELRIRIFNDYKGAFNDYNKAIRTSDKKNWDLYFSRAKCNIKLKKYEEAAVDLKEASELKPAYDSLYFYLAEINNYHLYKYRDAIRDYREVLVLNSEFEEAYFGKAICHQYLGELKQSISDFNKVLEFQPTSGRTYYYRAYSLLGMNDTIGACNDWKQGNKLSFSASEDALAKYCR
jgi:curved DNA-binding protein CbpA